MMRLAIIGQGIAGLTLAYRLVKRGLVPTVIGDRGLPWRATEAAQGVLCNKGLLWPRQPLFTAKLASLNWVRTWLDEVEATTGCSINRDFTGVYEPYFSAADYKRIVSRVYKGQFTGAFQTENLPASALPCGLSAQPMGTLFYPGDGWFNPQQLLNALSLYVQQQGVRLIEQQVASLEPARTGVTLRWPDGSGQNFDGVVIAAGAGSARLLKPWEPLGLSLFYHPGQVLKINQTLPSRYALVRKTWSLVAREAVFFGSTTDKIASMDTPWRPEPTEAMLAKLGEEFGWRPTPSQSADSSVETLWGVRLRTGLRQPVFGSLKPLAPDSIGSDRVYLLTGFYKNGLQLADRFASWLTAEILGEDLETLAKAFHTSQYQKA